MVSPRRSPRLKGPSPKPELPRRPKPPKRVKDVAEDSVRQANYQVEVAAWEATKVAHDKLTQKRKAKQNATAAAARKSCVESTPHPHPQPPQPRSPRRHS